MIISWFPKPTPRGKVEVNMGASKGWRALQGAAEVLIQVLVDYELEAGTVKRILVP